MPSGILRAAAWCPLPPTPRETSPLAQLPPPSHAGGIQATMPLRELLTAQPGTGACTHGTPLSSPARPWQRSVSLFFS